MVGPLVHLQIMIIKKSTNMLHTMKKGMSNVNLRNILNNKKMEIDIKKIIRVEEQMRIEK